MEWITTSTILSDLRDFGNEDAWERFVSRFRPPLLSFARSAGLSASDAQDVAQETLAAFADSFREGAYDRGKGRLSSWLFGIAYRNVLRQRRQSARNRRDALPAVGSSFWANVPDENVATTIWDREWEASLIRQCVEQARNEFSGQTFRVFELAVLEDSPARRVAETMNLPIKSVYNAKHRVLMRVRELRERLEEV